MEKEPTTAEIRLMGEKIPLRTTDNDPEFAAEVIDLVSTRIDEVEKRLQGKALSHQVTLLALLDLAEEYIRARKRTEQYRAELESRCEELLQKLQDAGGSEAPSSQEESST